VIVTAVVWVTVAADRTGRIVVSSAVVVCVVVSCGVVIWLGGSPEHPSEGCPLANG